MIDNFLSRLETQSLIWTMLFRMFLVCISHRSCRISLITLGFWFDSGLKFDKQIDGVVKSCFFHLRRLAKVKSFLSTKNFEKVIHAFVISCLDYCNSLYYGINCSSMERLQLVQNAAARLLTGTRKYQHISPILISLQCLPIKLRVEFKILILFFKSLNSLAPVYLTEFLHKPVRTLRSEHLKMLSVPRSRLKHRGDRVFSVAGNSLEQSPCSYPNSTFSIHF